jgi:hypothetical protein
VTDPLACFPMKIDWEKTVPPAMEAFPLPIVSSRNPTLFGEPLPDPVLKLSEFAREHSWEVRAQYSQGHQPHAKTGRPGALKDVIGLRFGAHPLTDRQAYAIYMRNASGGTWAWDSVVIWGPDLPPFGGCGITDLKEFLREPGRPAPNMLAWVAVIRHRRDQQEEEAKVRAKERGPVKIKREGFQ